MAPSNKSKPNSGEPAVPDNGEQPTATEGQAPDSGEPAVPDVGGDVPAPDGGERSPEPTRDEDEEARLLRELESSDVPAAVKNVGRNVRRVGFAMVAPGETHKVTKRERESERMMKKVRHAIRTGFLVAAE